jgi:hypothetical protein
MGLSKSQLNRKRINKIASQAAAEKCRKTAQDGQEQAPAGAAAAVGFTGAETFQRFMNSWLTLKWSLKMIFRI